MYFWLHLMLITDQSGRGRSVILCSNDQNGLNVITDRLLYLTRLCRLFNLDTSVSRRLVLVYARPVIIYHPLPVPIPNPRWPRLHSLPAFTVPGHLHSFLLYLPSIPPQIDLSDYTCMLATKNRFDTLYNFFAIRCNHNIPETQILR